MKTIWKFPLQLAWDFIYVGTVQQGPFVWHVFKEGR